MDRNEKMIYNIKIINDQSKMTDATSEQMLLDSKLVGCMIRGLPSSALDQEMDDDKFKYINWLNREYLTIPTNITIVIFDISRYGKYTHTINFFDPVSEKIAIEAVEQYLSEPLTKEYYLIIVDDLFHEAPWEQAKEWFKNRDERLTGCWCLERTKIKDGIFSFFIGF